jgi:lysozyme
MKPSINAINLIKEFEGYKDKSYLCVASKWTIGFGSTMWNDGKPVKQGEKITIQGAENLLLWELNKKMNSLDGLILNQNQVDALISFVYNVGSSAFAKSTLKKKIKVNPNDISIRAEFMKWNKARVNGVLQPVKGLTRRREAEANLYFTI